MPLKNDMAKSIPEWLSELGEAIVGTLRQILENFQWHIRNREKGNPEAEKICSRPLSLKPSLRDDSGSSPVKNSP